MRWRSTSSSLERHPPDLLVLGSDARAEEFLILLRAAASTGRPVGAGPGRDGEPRPTIRSGLEALEGAYLKAVWLRVNERTSRPRGEADFELIDRRLTPRPTLIRTDLGRSGAGT